MARSLLINDRLIDDEHDCFVIAEIGHNHQGDMEQAYKLIAAAAECGADAVKIQKRHNKSLFTPQIYDAPYENENSFGSTYGQHRDYLELEPEQIAELMAYAREKGLIMFSTVFDFISADQMAALDAPAYKMASGDLFNTPLLKHVAALGKPMIMSTGGATMDDVRRAVDTVGAINPDFALLQCTAGYPPAFNELNLRVLTTFRDEFPDTVVGLSSHVSGIAMDLAAYMLGARIVEKHFTLNRAAKGTDHAFSLERPGLRKLVRDFRRARVAMGDGVKRSYESEAKPLYKMAKKLVAASDLAEGTVLAQEHVAIKSPNDGLPPYELDNVLGRRLKRALKADENLAWEDLEEKG
ncbi:MAG: N-acetylneuraminate synthase family protein [Desulfarculaceae bacterium]|nr:N-acetylneuraminate synthase family protein [Desulfarculaceae bacterium]